MEPSLAAYNRPLFFYGWSLVIPWGFWFLVGYISHSAYSDYTALQGILGIIGLLAPILVATYLFLSNRNLLTDLKTRLFSLKGITLHYLLIALLLPPISIIIAQLLSLLMGHSLAQFHISGHPSFSSALFSPWFLLMFAPLVEELAWHSYGTDALRRRYNLFTTGIIFAIFWALWHIPLASVKGYYQNNLLIEGWQYTLNFFLSVFIFVILINWLYMKAARNIWITVIFHLSANLSNEIFATHPDSKIIQSLLFLLLVIYLVRHEHALFFNKPPL
ncbi:MAG: CPBP family intramembrane metalloprotease [Cardiobacteriaceae bacterium]|nr:CPBP family intramembrane metalloprotease [Cardiobacteriaceae bacterium]